MGIGESEERRRITDELKTILDRYLRQCRENNKEPYADNGVTDVNMKNANRLCDMYLSVHPSDREQDTQRTATEADREHFNRLLYTSEHIAKVTGTDKEIVFRALLESISNSPVIHPSAIIRNADLIADAFVPDKYIRDCIGVSGDIQ